MRQGKDRRETLTLNKQTLRTALGAGVIEWADRFGVKELSPSRVSLLFETGRDYRKFRILLDTLMKNVDMINL